MSSDDPLLAEPLLAPFAHVASAPGKGIRTALIQAFHDAWMPCSPMQLADVQRLIARLHNASLVVDDIEDSSTSRRGVPCSHMIWGVPASINAANTVYFMALRDCAKMGSRSATRALVDEMCVLHRGQGCDIWWRDSGNCPTEEEYVQMVLDKTGGLFRLALRLLMAFTNGGAGEEREAGSTPTPQSSSAIAGGTSVGDDVQNSDSIEARNAHMIALVEYLGVHFQIRDDYLNLASTAYYEQKTFCEDFTEGKFSFPVIHHIRNNPAGGNCELAKILRQRTHDVELKRYALKLLQASGSLEYSLEALARYEKLIRTEMAALPPNPQLEAIVQKLFKLPA